MNHRKQQDIGRDGARQRQDRLARGVLGEFWGESKGFKDLTKATRLSDAPK